MLAIAGQAQDFTAGNLVVSRVGNGATALGTATAPVSLLEFDKTTASQASPVKTVNIGSAVGSSKLTLAGTAVYEGQLNASTNGQYLSILGYDVPAGELAASTGISSIAVAVGGGGINYTFASVITISGGGGTGAAAVINSIGTGGVITGIRITNSGSGYTSTPTVSISIGTGFTAGTINRVPYWQGISSKKVLGRIDKTGAVDFSTNFSNSSFAGGTSKNAVSIDGSKYWLNSGGRIEYVAYGQTTDATQVVNAGPRSIGIFNNQLYYLLGFTNAALLYTNTALPEATTTATALPLSLSTSESPMGFVFLDMDPGVSYNGTGYDLLYIAEIIGGLEKYYFDGTNWLPVNSRWTPTAAPLNNAIFPGAVVCALTGELNAMGQPVIYAVSGNSIAVNNNLFAITDASGRTGTMVLNTNTTSVTLATAGANYSFKGIAFAPTVSILPIQLTAFNGSLINGITSLKWITASEINAKEFGVERSANGIDFTAVGTVAAKNGNPSNNYSFDDINPLSGINYYRLKLLDKDGKFRYSSTVVIKTDIKKIGLSVFPNPVINSLVISHQKASEGTIIRIVGIDGKTLAQYKVAKDAVQTSVNASDLIAGQYFVSFISKNQKATISFIK